MNKNITYILKALYKGNDTVVLNSTWAVLFKALMEAEDNRERLEKAEAEANSAWAKRTKEADYNEDNDSDYNLSVRAGNAYRRAEAARKVEDILLKAVEDIYREGYAKIEEEA